MINEAVRSSGPLFVYPFCVSGEGNRKKSSAEFERAICSQIKYGVNMMLIYMRKNSNILFEFAEY